MTEPEISTPCNRNLLNFFHFFMKNAQKLVKVEYTDSWWCENDTFLPRKSLSYSPTSKATLHALIHQHHINFLGLQENNSDVWKLFAAVIVHAVAIQFCIGTEMITMGTKKLQVGQQIRLRSV